MVEPEKRSTSTVRGTQSFVYTMSACWRRPSITAAEILWRWAYGIPAATLLWFAAVHVVHVSGADLSDLRKISLIDPAGAATTIDRLWTVLRPGSVRTVAWLAPLLFVGWVVASALGRTVVLRRADPQMHARPAVLILLHALRLAVLSLSVVIWWILLQWASHAALADPMAAGHDPDIVLYAALVIVATLLVFVLWGAGSWSFSVAPMIAMLRGLTTVQSLKAAFSLGAMRAKLVEINLVMGIVKIALIVLAMVASASPLPFQTVITAGFMTWWYAGVTVVYLIASDFFHVVRLMAYVEMWRIYAD